MIEEKMSFDEKMFNLQQDVEPILKTETNPFFKSKYSDINGTIAQIKPFLKKYRLRLKQPTFITDGKEAIKTVIKDIDSDSYDESSLFLPTGSKPQEMGLTITYYRRYTLKSLLGLEDEDDDGNVSSQVVQAPKVVQKTVVTPKKAPGVIKEDSPF